MAVPRTEVDPRRVTGPRILVLGALALLASFAGGVASAGQQACGPAGTAPTATPTRASSRRREPTGCGRGSPRGAGRRVRSRRGVDRRRRPRRRAERRGRVAPGRDRRSPGHGAAAVRRGHPAGSRVGVPLPRGNRSRRRNAEPGSAGDEQAARVVARVGRRSARECADPAAGLERPLAARSRPPSRGTVDSRCATDSHSVSSASAWPAGAVARGTHSFRETASSIRDMPCSSCDQVPAPPGRSPPTRSGRSRSSGVVVGVTRCVVDLCLPVARRSRRALALFSSNGLGGSAESADCRLRRRVRIGSEPAGSRGAVA